MVTKTFLPTVPAHSHSPGLAYCHTQGNEPPADHINTHSLWRLPLPSTPPLSLSLPTSWSVIPPAAVLWWPCDPFHQGFEYNSQLPLHYSRTGSPYQLRCLVKRKGFLPHPTFRHSIQRCSLISFSTSGTSSRSTGWHIFSMLTTHSWSFRMAIASQGLSLIASVARDSFYS